MVSNYPILSTLIFGLGAIGAVIAPVAAVVSCNDEDARFNETTIKSAVELKTFAAKFGYDLPASIASNSFTALAGTAEVKVQAYKHTAKPGKEKNIAIIIKGTPTARTAVATQAEKDDIKDFDGRWGFSENDLKTAKFVAFLHTYSDEEKAKDKTIGNKNYSISWLEIQKDSNGQVIAHDIPTDPVNRF